MLSELSCSGIKYPITKANQISLCHTHNREAQFHGFHRRFDGVLRIGHLSINVNLRHFALQLFVRKRIPHHAVIVVHRVRVSMNRQVAGIMRQ